MYKSGDLAEWRKDGNILFHGRKDNQVKMRGFRIETEEIERNIEQLKEVKKALIVPLEKNNQITYLIAFIINTAKLKTEKIKSFLSSRLPNYMIPYKFYFLKKIPVTVNGKTDIKKLLDIHNESEKKRTAEIDIVMPRTELQKKIYKTWQKILGRNDFGIHDDFFKSGGDSIKAIQFVNSYFLHKYNVSVQDLYNYPTIELFSKELTKKNKGSMNNLVYVEDHIKINSDMKKKNIKICGEEYKINNVLITDPEGFISIHILNSLKMLKKCNVYCLVSKKNIYNENKFKKNILEYYFPGKYKSLSEHNIFLVPGDICDMYLSMGKDNYNSLLNKIDTIYHYAPMLNFFGNYKDIEKVNVFGTENIIKFSLLSGAKLNYISTLSVSGRSLVAQTKNNPLFDENSLNIGQKYQDNIYVRSKLEAEKSILNNEKNGLIYSIFRLGNISERYNDGVFQRNIYDNWQHIILKILINLSVIPDTIFHTELDFTPVDYSSEFIIRLSQIKESENRIFHIKNQNTITFKKLFNLFQNYGINVSILKSISYKEFLKYINRIKHENEWELSMLGEEFNYDRIFGEDYQVDIKSEITQKYLSLLNLSWPEIDEAYIKKILDYWKKVGFISGV
jgi:thioester reductase-like protein